MKNLTSFALISLTFLALLFSSCQPDETINTTGFGDAPAASLITTGSVEVITENEVRYHVIQSAATPSIFTVTFVETATGLVAVDLGPNSALKGQELRAYADAINKPISVIITHNHPDHYHNITAFADAPIYAQTDVADLLMNFNVPLPFPNFNQLYTGTVNAVASSQTLYGLEYKFDAISGAETTENGYVFIPSKSILFAGDLIFNNHYTFLGEYTPLVGDDELTNWMTGLDMLKAMFSNYNHVFVGHSGQRSDVGTVIDEQKAFLMDVQGLIKGTKMLSSGSAATTNQEVINELQMLYPNYNGTLNTALNAPWF